MNGVIVGQIIGKGVAVISCADCHGSMGMNTDYIIGLPAAEQALP